MKFKLMITDLTPGDIGLLSTALENFKAGSTNPIVTEDIDSTIIEINGDRDEIREVLQIIREII